MFAAGKTNAVSGVTYVDDVFSTWLYTGNGSTQTITNGIGIGADLIQEASYTTAGTYSWTAPAGVTSVCVVCVGGGGNDSYFINATTVKGGKPTGATGGGYVGDGGGNGGTAGVASSNGDGFHAGGGGGGAGGYSGNGGNGGNGTGDGVTQEHAFGAGGGGVGIYGEGSNGSGANNGSGGGGGGGFGANVTTNGSAGAGGSSGSNGGSGDIRNGGLYGGGAGGLTTAIGGAGLGWKNNISVTPGNSYTVVVGGSYQGVNEGTSQGGAVRIIWGGGRAFPSTNAGQVFSGLNAGGLVWIKRRDSNESNFLFDTERGVNVEFNSNATEASSTLSNSVTSFNSNGFSLSSASGVNTNAGIYAAWTFRKQAKFFDVVTYTGNGTTQNIAHSLGTNVGMVVVKRTDSTAGWRVWHRGLTSGNYIMLNSTNAQSSTFASSNFGNNTITVDPTSAQFTVGQGGDVNANGGTYVAYLFAHDTATDGLIQCGSFTTDGTGKATVTLGFEPQFLLYKCSTAAEGWYISDVMRGFGASETIEKSISPNTSAAEAALAATKITSTGFQTVTNLQSFATYIYLAIRRPNKPPTSGTQIFQPTVYTGTNVDNRLVNTTIAPDMVFVRQRNDTVLGGMVVGDRLRGQPYLLTGTTAAEVDDADAFDAQIVSAVEYGNAFSSMNGFWCGNDATAKLNINTTSNNHIAEAFKRAPGVFDVVCYTGTGSARTVSHNLGVAPELMITKKRSEATNSSFWWVYHKDFVQPYYALLNSNAAGTATGTALYASVGATAYTAQQEISQSSQTYVAYLFASLPGISKVGTYTGNGGTAGTNGTSQTINCGFAAGARFVLIKRTDNTGDWYVFDSARGITSGNDCYLRTNSAGAEEFNNDHIDPDNSGFVVNQEPNANLNVTNATYIYLAYA